MGWLISAHGPLGSEHEPRHEKTCIREFAIR